MANRYDVKQLFKGQFLHLRFQGQHEPIICGILYANNILDLIYPEFTEMGFKLILTRWRLRRLSADKIADITARKLFVNKETSRIGQ